MTSVESIQCKTDNTFIIGSIPKVYLDQNHLKKLLIEKIKTLESKTILETIDINSESSRFLMKIKVITPFYRKHPLASYKDPGEKPRGIIKKLKVINKLRWKKAVKAILPFQTVLMEHSSSLYFSKNLLENKFTEIVKEIDAVATVYQNNYRLQVISMLAQLHFESKALDSNQIFSIVSKVHSSEISDEAIILSKSLLKACFLDSDLLNIQASTSLLQSVMKHINTCLLEDTFTKTFLGFWNKYTLTETKASVLFYLFQVIINNYKILIKNGYGFDLLKGKTQLESISFEDMTNEEIDQFFVKVLEPKNFESPEDDWFFTQNICDAYLCHSLMKLNF